MELTQEQEEQILLEIEWAIEHKPNFAVTMREAIRNGEVTGYTSLSPDPLGGCWYGTLSGGVAALKAGHRNIGFLLKQAIALYEQYVSFAEEKGLDITTCMTPLERVLTCRVGETHEDNEELAYLYEKLLPFEEQYLSSVAQLQQEVEERRADREENAFLSFDTLIHAEHVRVYTS